MTTALPADAALHDEVRRRRTFGIISHPDAGKTTLTEQLLLLGGAIHLAGDVRATGGPAQETQIPGLPTLVVERPQYPVTSGTNVYLGPAVGLRFGR